MFPPWLFIGNWGKKEGWGWESGGPPTRAPRERTLLLCLAAWCCQLCVYKDWKSQLRVENLRAWKEGSKERKKEWRTLDRRRCRAFDVRNAKRSKNKLPAQTRAFPLELQTKMFSNTVVCVNTVWCSKISFLPVRTPSQDSCVIFCQQIW